MTVLAVGRLGQGPEASLAADYIARASAVGRALALGPVDIVEIDARRGGRTAEGETMATALAAFDRAGRLVVACDEHGGVETSRGLAVRIGAWRDQGVRRLVFLIGGADGLAPTVLEAADARLAFGVMTWPHALARVMLAEQLYRATAILAGAPYHRD